MSTDNDSNKSELVRTLECLKERDKERVGDLGQACKLDEKSQCYLEPGTLNRPRPFGLYKVGNIDFEFEFEFFFMSLFYLKLKMKQTLFIVRVCWIYTGRSS